MKTNILIAAAFAVAGFVGSAANAASILPVNETTVKVTADLEGLGLGGAPTGSATVTFDAGAPIFAFDITGGTVDADGASIEHDGSGVQLFALADTSISATVGNFVIDTAETGVFGNVNGGADLARLFDLGDLTADGIILNISTDLAGALSAVFGAPDLAGVQFGFANTNPEVAPVPLPASAALLMLGVAGLGYVGRRRKAA